MGTNVRNAEYSGWVLSIGESLAAFSHTNLEQLRVLEANLNRLQRTSRMGEELIQYVGDAADSIAVGKPAFVVDPDGTVSKKFEDAGDSIADIVAALTKSRDRAVPQHVRATEFQNSLVSAFNETIEVYSRMYALVEDLRCAIGEHDADISPVVGSYENVEDLIASLR